MRGRHGRVFSFLRPGESNCASGTETAHEPGGRGHAPYILQLSVHFNGLGQSCMHLWLLTFCSACPFAYLFHARAPARTRLCHVRAGRALRHSYVCCLCSACCHRARSRCVRTAHAFLCDDDALALTTSAWHSSWQGQRVCMSQRMRAAARTHTSLHTVHSTLHTRSL